MNLIIETDIGHDPDDFFAIAYLLAAGVNVQAITITPGDPDQIAIAKFLCEEVGLDIPVGVSKPNREKLSSGSIHHELLKKYGRSLEAKPDGLGYSIIDDVVEEDTELFIIGPASSVGMFIEKNSYWHFPRATMQGGFVPYSEYRPEVTLDKFEGKSWMPTFNLNGDRRRGQSFLDASIGDRQMVGKNICHTIIFDRSKFSNFAKPTCRAAELFIEAGEMYLARHDEKKFHDPTAAVAHLHSDVGTWLFGKTVKRESGWACQVDVDLDKNTDVHLVDVFRDKLWSYLWNWF